MLISTYMLPTMLKAHQNATSNTARGWCDLSVLFDVLAPCLKSMCVSYVGTGPDISLSHFVQSTICRADPGAITENAGTMNLSCIQFTGVMAL